VDNNGNIFRGWNHAYAYTNTLDVPLVPNVSTLENTDPFKAQLCSRDNTAAGYGGASRNLQTYNLPDMVWFRTMSEASNFGVPTEVIYRLGRGFVLEKGISRRLTEVDIKALSEIALADLLESRFQFTPIGFRVRELQFRYYRVDAMNQTCDQRANQGKGDPHWIDYWPPAAGSIYDLTDTTTNAANYSWAFDTPAARRARVPAAVQVTMRIGDSSDHEWTDYYSTEIVDGYDQPRTDSYYIGGRTAGGNPIDGIKQTDYYVDEVGMIFRLVMFIPTYINALGGRRGDL
jgi:hypothetical protein